ncbi:MAG: TIGR01212 family radical SAM protein [Kiritimatiellia bacterium]
MNPAASTPSPPPVPARGYNAHGGRLREAHGGARVFKVVVDAGFTCPNRDGSKGYGGCAYCNVESFTPALPRGLPSIHDQVLAGARRAREKYRAEKFIVYFQPNTNTYAPVGVLRAKIDEALAACPEDVVGLAVGTRPDCLDAEKIALLESYLDRVEVDLEIGMESMHDETLRSINRGCTHADFTAAMALLGQSRLHVCVHAVFGLPGETREMMLAVADELNRHPRIGSVKLHQLLVVKGSILAARHRREPFPVFTLEEYAGFLCEFLPRLRGDIVVQRLFSVADRDLLIAPDWGLRKSEIRAALERELRRRGVVQGAVAGL